MDHTDRYDGTDIEKNIFLSVFCYIPILVLIPTFIELFSKKSPYLRFHVNQGLVLFLTEVIMTTIVKIAGFFLGSFWYPLATVMHILTVIIAFGFLVLAVLGIIVVLHRKAQELPLFGSLTLIK